MAKIEELVIGVSPLTNKIYAGFVSKSDPRLFTSKVDVTDQVLNAVAAHMQEAHKDDHFDGYGWSYGNLTWTPKESDTP